MRRFGGLLLSGSALFAALAAVVSCGGTSTDSEPVTLDDACDVLPKKYCAQDRPCCEKAGYGYDRAGCEEAYRESCLVDVAAIGRHKAVLHPEKLDACLAGFQPYEDKCQVTSAEVVKSLSVAACYQVIQGTVPIGEPCDSLSDCAPKLWPEGVYCDTTCQVLHFAGEGQTCDADSSCGPGLLCESGRCVSDGETLYVVQKDRCVGSPFGVPGDGGAP